MSNTTINIPKISNGGNTSITTDDMANSSSSIATMGIKKIGTATGGTEGMAQFINSSKVAGVNLLTIYQLGATKGDYSSSWMLPCTPQDITERYDAQVSTQSFLGRSAPYQIYQGNSARTVDFSLTLHREMTDDLNYVGNLVAALEAAVYPEYKSLSILYPLVRFQFIDTLSINGILTSLGVVWKTPIINNMHMVVELSITVSEVCDTLPQASIISGQGPKRPSLG